jgi:hypothetical protein
MTASFAQRATLTVYNDDESGDGGQTQSHPSHSRPEGSRRRQSRLLSVSPPPNFGMSGLTSDSDYGSPLVTAARGTVPNATPPQPQSAQDPQHSGGEVDEDAQPDGSDNWEYVQPESDTSSNARVAESSSQSSWSGPNVHREKVALHNPLSIAPGARC